MPGWNGSKMVWVGEEHGIVKKAWLCMYVHVNMRTVQGKDEMMHF